MQGGLRACERVVPHGCAWFFWSIRDAVLAGSPSPYTRAGARLLSPLKVGRFFGLAFLLKGACRHLELIP